MYSVLDYLQKKKQHREKEEERERISTKKLLAVQEAGSDRRGHVVEQRLADADNTSHRQLGLMPTHPGATVTLHVDCGDWTCISSHVAIYDKYDDCAADSLSDSNNLHRFLVCKELFACSGHAVRVMH